ncbi:MAG: ABC transporter ATP-binding protein, partial [Planctomycetota bacterium]
MSDIAIRVENLGKKFRIGTREPYLRLSEVPGRALSGMWNLARQRLQRTGDCPNFRAGDCPDFPLGENGTVPLDASGENGTVPLDDGDERPTGAAQTSPSGSSNRQTAHPPSDPNEFWALKDVSFEVKRGEVLGIIGRNGAGKSTLLKILSRITRPTTGEIRIRGRVGSLLEVGTGFHPELTGRENIFLNGAILGMTRAEIRRKFDEIVSFAEIEQFLDTPVKHYSSGMYMRLAFAVAAHLEPEILIVDEVLAVGDAEFQKKCLGKMGEVARGGRTVLFVSHNMNAVESLCSTACRLAEGTIRESGADIRKVICSHLVSPSKHAAPSEWRTSGQPTGAPYFRPLRLAVCDSGGNPVTGPVPNDTRLWVVIEAEVDVVDPSLTIGYSVYTEQGTLLYWSYHTDGAPETWPAINRGLVTLRSRLPTRLLNEGTYRIELIGGLHCRLWLFEPGHTSTAVFLTISGGLSDSPLFTTRRPGLLS